LLLRQHSLTHYPYLIWLFGAPNGISSSITESQHICAVKEPWRRSNRNEALSQMLVTNQRHDQLTASFLDLLPPPSPCIRLKDTALPPRLASVLGPLPPLATPSSLVDPGWYLPQLCYRESVVAWQLSRSLNRAVRSARPPWVGLTLRALL